MGAHWALGRLRSGNGQLGPTPINYLRAQERLVNVAPFAYRVLASAIEIRCSR